MSKAYLPKETWVTCTFQQNPNPQQLIPTRTTRSVYYGDKLELLTIKDRNIDKKFVCKKPVSMGLAIGGLIVGLLLFSNPFGWIVTGIACAVVLAGAATYATVTHDCSGPLEAGVWFNEKDGVRFNGHLAITEASMLSCKKGGMLQPFISYDAAKNAAKAIAWENTKGTITITVGAIAGGYLLGGGKGLITAINKIRTVKGGLFTLGGIATTYAMTSYQSSVMRGSEAYANNEVYQRMNEEEKIVWSNPNEVKDEVVDVLLEDIKGGVLPPDLEDQISDLYGVVQLYKTGRIIIQVKQLLSKVKQIEGLSRQQLYRSDIAKEILKDFKNGKYGDVHEAIKRPDRFNQNRITPTMRQNAREFIDNKIKKNKWSLKNENSLASKGLGIALFFVPLVENYFSENARRVLAENAVKDVTGTISVRTSN